MQSIKIKSHIGRDGILSLDIPVGLSETDVEVVVNIEPLPSESDVSTPESLGWPVGFFEQTFGSFRSEPLMREEQGKYEIRDDVT